MEYAAGGSAEAAAGLPLVGRCHRCKAIVAFLTMPAVGEVVIFAMCASLCVCLLLCHLCRVHPPGPACSFVSLSPVVHSCPHPQASCIAATRRMRVCGRAARRSLEAYRGRRGLRARDRVLAGSRGGRVLVLVRRGLDLRCDAPHACANPWLSNLSAELSDARHRTIRQADTDSGYEALRIRPLYLARAIMQCVQRLSKMTQQLVLRGIYSFWFP